MSFFPKSLPSDTTRFIVGLGCLLCWIRIIDFSKYYGVQYRGFIDAFSIVLPEFLKVGVCIL
jgi:hypothetical protein